MISKILFYIRDWRSLKLFKVLIQYVTGDVLDVGGGKFFDAAKKRGVNFKTWTCLEIDASQVEVNPADDRFKLVVGDGCNMPFSQNQFDVALNIQVLEHVFDPLKMLEEMNRVLKPGGKVILLVPQTSNLHGIPHHYYNFTRYWIARAMADSGFDILLLEPLGGYWSTLASRLFYFFLQGFGHPAMTVPGTKRPFMFYLLFPLMIVTVIVCVPLFLLLSLGDLVEEPNNHLVVARKVRA